MKKVALHCESIAGGGHMPIIANLARALGQQKLGTYLLTSQQSYDRGSEQNFGATEFAMLPDFVRNPETGRATLTPDGLEYTQDPAYQELRAATIIEHLERIQPDVLITDSWPLGKGHFDAELLPALERFAADIKVYNLARDVMFYKHEGRDGLDNDREAARIINQFFDGIFVTGDKSLFQFEDSFGAAEEIGAPIMYAGYFAPDMPRRSMMLDKDRKVLVSLGGGFTKESSLPVYMSAIEARKSSSLADYGWKVFVSHDCDEETFDQIKAKAASESPDGRIEVVRNNAHYRQELADAAGVICQAGLNTTIEVIQTRRMASIPVVMCPIVPANGLSVTGQDYRARMLSEHNLAAVIHHTDFGNPARFVEAIDTQNRLKFATAVPDISNDGPNFIANYISSALTPSMYLGAAAPDFPFQR